MDRRTFQGGFRGIVHQDLTCGNVYVSVLNGREGLVLAYMRIGDLLVSVGQITQEQLDEALEQQKTSKKRLGQVLIDSGVISEQQMIDTLQLQLGIDFVDLTKIHIPTEMARLVPKNIAKKYSVVPVKVVRDELILAMADPLNFMALEDVRSVTRKRVTPVIAASVPVERAIAALYGDEGAARAIEEMSSDTRAAAASVSDAHTAQDLDAESQAAPTVRLVNSILERAAVERASDVHLEPQEGDLVVRMRVDGLLRPALTVPRDLQAAVVSRLKIMSGMNIAEHRVPQDGRASVRVRGSDIDLRVSTLPTIYGEKVVIRLLDHSRQFEDARSLGLEGEDLEKYNALMKNTRGVVLIVGPTGSGKSSTMHAMIRALNSQEINLVTLEDPVEYHIPGVNQVQINEKSGMTFANGLRSILRQDPDVIAVGEIRDGETAEIAMRAAITGHLVLSTVHTNDAVSSLDRLLDIGVEPYLIAEALTGVICQRLVRRICPHCRETYDPPPEELEWMGLPADSGVRFSRGRGCPECYHTGYAGRTGVFEVMLLHRETKRIIAEGRSRAELMEVLQKERFTTLEDNCRRLVREGVTTVEEAVRTINTTV